MQYINLIEKKKHGTDLFPFEYYGIDSTHPRYFMNYHWHAEYEMIRVLKGSLRMTMNEKSFEAKAGELVFVHGGILHSGVPSDCEYECLVFDLNTFMKTTPACAAYIQKIIDRSALVHHHFHSDQKKLMGIADVIFTTMKHQKSGYELVTVGALFSFFGEVFASHLYLESLPRPSHRDVRRTLQLRNVIDYMDHHLSSQVTLKQLADVAMMSPKYFCRFFYQMTHHTPIEYLNMQRIEYACYALTTTDEPVTSIALNCGFNDLSYFIKTFKRYKGITPRQFRR